MSLDIVNPFKRIVMAFVDRFGFYLYQATKSKKKAFQDTYEFSRKNFERILIIRCDHVGDLLMSTPVFEAIRKKYNGAKISVLVGSWAKELVEFNPYIDEVIVYDCPWWVSVRKGKIDGLICNFINSYIHLLKKLQKSNFDLAIDLRGDFRHILLFCFFSGAKFRISYSRTGGKYLLSASPPYPYHLHEVDKNFALIKVLGIENSEERPFLRVIPSDRDHINNILHQAGISSDDKLVAIHPLAQTKVRRWRSDLFAKVADYIVQYYNAKIVLIGGRGDMDYGEQIEQQMNYKPVILMGKTTLRELAVLFERCNLLICVESGIIHLAATTDVPVIALYGPIRPENTKPRRDNITVISKYWPCSPCRFGTCPVSPSDMSTCMEAISESDVTKEIDRILNMKYMINEKVNINVSS